MALYYGLTWDFMGVNGKMWIIYEKLRFSVDKFLLESIEVIYFLSDGL